MSFLFFFEEQAISKEENDEENPVDINLTDKDEVEDSGLRDQPAKDISPGNFQIQNIMS